MLFCLDNTPSKDWPNKGRIEFKNFYLRYSSDTPNILKNINVLIQPTEKVFFDIVITDRQWWPLKNSKGG